jgi:hypothetical protein
MQKSKTRKTTLIVGWNFLVKVQNYSPSFPRPPTEWNLHKREYSPDKKSRDNIAGVALPMRLILLRINVKVKVFRGKILVRE